MRETWTAAVLALLLAVALTALGTFVGEPDAEQTGSYWIVVVVIVLVTAGVFALVVRAAEAGRANPAKTALVLAFIGLFSVIVFWLGLPAIFAVAGAFLAMRARAAQGEERLMSTSALVVAGITLLLAVYSAFFG